MSISPERKHHRYSPSKLQMLEACPCYENREGELHERAIAGTRAHNVAETGQDDARLSDEDVAAAVDCIDFVSTRKTEMEKAGPVTELKETYLPIDDIHFPDGVEATTAGYIDAAIISHCGTLAECFDFKFGRWPVEKAEDNLQGIAYVLGLLKRYPSLQQVTFHFKQPHLDSVSSATFSRDQIPELYLRVQVVVARAREARRLGDFSMARPMVPACNFCAHLGVCPKVEAIALKVGNKFFPLEIPDDITPTKLHDRKSASLAMRLAQVVKIWAGAYTSRTSDRVIRGEQDLPENYSIKENHGKRSIADVEKFKSIALKYLTPEELAAVADYSFGSVEEIIQTKAPRGLKAAAVSEFKTELDQSGAVSRGNSFSFLMPVPAKKADNSTGDIQKPN